MGVREAILGGIVLHCQGENGDDVIRHRSDRGWKVMEDHDHDITESPLQLELRNLPMKYKSCHLSRSPCKTLHTVSSVITRSSATASSRVNSVFMMYAKPSCWMLRAFIG